MGGGKPPQGTTAVATPTGVANQRGEVVTGNAEPDEDSLPHEPGLDRRRSTIREQCS